MQCDAVCRIPSYDLVNKMFEHRQLMRANGYGKRGAGLAGKEKMPWFTNVDDLMKALNSKYEPVMHIVEGENSVRIRKERLLPPFIRR